MRTLAAALVVLCVGLGGGYMYGSSRGEDRAWDQATARAWRVRAGGACDGAYETAVFLADALLAGKEPLSESAYDRWRVLAEKLGETPEAYSRDVYESLPSGATVGWTEGLATSVAVGESMLPAAMREAHIPASQEWLAVGISGSVAAAVEAFPRAPSWFYEGLCYEDYAIAPANIRPGTT